MAVLVSVVLLLVKVDIAVAFVVCFRLVGRKALEATLYTRNPFLYKHSLMAVTLPDARERCSPIYGFRCERIEYPYDSCIPTNSPNRSGTFLYRELVVLGLRRFVSTVSYQYLYRHGGNRLTFYRYWS